MATEEHFAFRMPRLPFIPSNASFPLFRLQRRQGLSFFLAGDCLARFLQPIGIRLVVEHDQVTQPYLARDSQLKNFAGFPDLSLMNHERLFA